MEDEDFLDHVAERLARLPGVTAVALGGSRAQRSNRPDSDWDLAVYYRHRFDPQVLRDLGWPGQVGAVGGWGGGVFNGGAHLQVDGRPVDVHYRDLVVVERELSQARIGQFHVEPLMFHLAGIPSYLVLAELGVNEVLRGDLPRPHYPEALRINAPQRWWSDARMTFDYAERPARDAWLTQCCGLVAQAATQAAHAVMAARGEWVTNEKGLLARAGLREVDTLLAATDRHTDSLTAMVHRAREICGRAVDSAVRTRQ